MPGVACDAGAFDGYAEKTACISQTSLLNFERSRYIVDGRFASRVAALRAYAECVVLMCGDEVIGDHPRFFGRGASCVNAQHACSPPKPLCGDLHTR